MPEKTANYIFSAFMFILTVTVGMLGWFLVDLHSRVRAYEEETPIIILREMRDDIKLIKSALKIQ
mgnify:CR=1 FL=1